MQRSFQVVAVEEAGLLARLAIACNQRNLLIRGLWTGRGEVGGQMSVTMCVEGEERALQQFPMHLRRLVSVCSAQEAGRQDATMTRHVVELSSADAELGALLPELPARWLARRPGRILIELESHPELLEHAMRRLAPYGVKDRWEVGSSDGGAAGMGLA